MRCTTTASFRAVGSSSREVNQGSRPVYNKGLPAPPRPLPARPSPLRVRPSRRTRRGPPRSGRRLVRRSWGAEVDPSFPQRRGHRARLAQDAGRARRVGQGAAGAAEVRAALHLYRVARRAGRADAPSARGDQAHRGRRPGVDHVSPLPQDERDDPRRRWAVRAADRRPARPRPAVADHGRLHGPRGAKSGAAAAALEGALTTDAPDPKWRVSWTAVEPGPQGPGS